ncbi:MAG: PQQ-binding-like beta-propeller repeat protein, partial [Anaerolineae bacterium]
GDWIEASPVVADNLVYFGSRDGYFYALDAQTGQEKWKRRLPWQGGCFILEPAHWTFHFPAFFTP